MASVHPALVVFVLSSYSLALLPTAGSVSPKVSLALYYEALCPFCSRFIVHSLPKIFADGLISIVDLHLLPFGNAQIGFNSSIACQHGPSECFFNTVEGCAINVWPDVRQHFSFVYCLENLILENKYDDWESCFQRTQLDPKALVDCYNSGRGQEIQLQYAAQTAALHPPHQYVPWMVVNGLPLYDDYDKFEAYVCKAFDGELPNACQGLTVKKPQHMARNKANAVCVMNDTGISSSAKNN
ncbi:hypothetical protein HPP92_018485 [Vanilla planifolia]|uniref:Gamma-interferon-inducible lysosomal thiol reductase n=1 Tax=Vanilla planifolia TaxID=51239 RepID=A0A835QHN2_VANPL|nr:hypothetical protein HPP92_018485 [Vanilla planifolia]